jgi:acyl dehydratase
MSTPARDVNTKMSYQRLREWRFPAVEQSYRERDTILYALGVGLGSDPCDAQQLRFVYEENLQTLPTMPVVLVGPGMWMRDPDSGIDCVRMLHGEQRITIIEPLPAAATVVGRSHVREVCDKGAGKQALVYIEREIRDKATGRLYSVLEQTVVCVGQGGFGGPRTAAPPPHPIPRRSADAGFDQTILPQGALLYRLSGDMNPLHADPGVAAIAGFKAPIFHGLGTLGVAGHAVLRICCEYDPSRFRSMQLRFVSPVYPGETVRTELWQDGSIVSFRCWTVERNQLVIDNGRVELS